MFLTYAESTGDPSANRFLDVYHRWLRELSWSAIRQALMYVNLRESSPPFNWFERPACHGLGERITARMIRGEFPRFQVAELTNSETTCLRMKLTTLWTPQQAFDRSVIRSAAQDHQDEDLANLLPDYHGTRAASELYSRAIAAARQLRPTETQQWPEKIASIKQQATEALNVQEPPSGSSDLPPISEVRKTVKKYWKRLAFQQRLLDEVMSYKCSKTHRYWRYPKEHRSLEQYLVTELFGSMGTQRTRAWLPIAIEEGFDVAELVHQEQLRLKGRSEVPSKYLP